MSWQHMHQGIVRTDANCTSLGNAYLYTSAQELHEYLKTVCGDLHVTKGDFDEDSSYPEQKVGNAHHIPHLLFVIVSYMEAINI